MTSAKELLANAACSWSDSEWENFRLAIEALGAGEEGHERWRELVDHDDEPLRSFQQVITLKPDRGLGKDMIKVRKTWDINWPEKSAWFREKMKLPHGPTTDSLSDNITETPTGTSKSYTLDRLQRERPDLYDQVIAGDLSANAAAIEAGFRYKTVSVRTDDVHKAVGALLRHFTRDQIVDALEESRRKSDAS